MYGCAHQYTGKSIQRTLSDKGDSLNGGNSLNALSDRIVPDRAKGVKEKKTAVSNTPCITRKSPIVSPS